MGWIHPRLVFDLLCCTFSQPSYQLFYKAILKSRQGIMRGDKVPMPVLDYAQEQCIDLHLYAVTYRYIILLIFDLIPVDYGYHRK